MLMDCGLTSTWGVSCGGGILATAAYDGWVGNIWVLTWTVDWLKIGCDRLTWFGGWFYYETL